LREIHIPVAFPLEIQIPGFANRFAHEDVDYEGYGVVKGADGDTGPDQIFCWGGDLEDAGVAG